MIEQSIILLLIQQLKLNVIKIEGIYDGDIDKYFSAIGITKPRINHLAGYTSWYNYFGNIDEKIILRDLDSK